MKLDFITSSHDTIVLGIILLVTLSLFCLAKKSSAFFSPHAALSNLRALQISLLLLLDRLKLNWNWRKKSWSYIFNNGKAWNFNVYMESPKSERWNKKTDNNRRAFIVMWTVLCLYLLWLSVACFFVVMRTPGWFFAAACFVPEDVGTKNHLS